MSFLEEATALNEKIVDGWIAIEENGSCKWHKIDKNLVTEIFPTGLDAHETVCGLRACGGPVESPLEPIQVCENCSGE